MHHNWPTTNHASNPMLSMHIPIRQPYTYPSQSGSTPRQVGEPDDISPTQSRPAGPCRAAEEVTQTNLIARQIGFLAL